jgi:lipopolysaccharide export system protein LptA
MRILGPLLFILSMLLELPAPAQTFGAMKGFKLAEPYGPPFEKQTKTLLGAGKALPTTGGAYLSDGVTLQAFTETNTPQFVVRAQYCFYSSTNHSVNSAGPLQMQTADGKFMIEGEGFFWLQTNSSLIISNNVHTLIQADLLQSPSTNRDDRAGAGHADSGPLSILSERFKYDGSSGLGTWQGHVRVNGTNLALNSETLTANVPIGDRKLHSLVADDDVAIDYFNEGLHATGGHLNYAPDTGLARLWEHATWHDRQREGRGEELIIDRTNHIFQVNSNAWLKLPGQAAGESGLLALSKPATEKPSNPAQRSIEITCDRYVIRTNLATFHNQVLLEERLNAKAGARMTCREMTVNFGSTNDLQTIIAEKDVLIDDQDKHIKGGHSVFTRTNSILEVTENPSWSDGSREGKGDLLRLNTQQNEMEVFTNAMLRLPANELAGQLTPTNKTATTRAPKAATNQIAQIYSERYTLRTNVSVFRGGVYVTHPEMNWSCETLTIQLPAAGTTNLVAEGNVDFNLLTEMGKVHGTSDKAVYSFGLIKSSTNAPQTIDQLRLVGTPAFLETTNRTVKNPEIIWDRARDKWILPGGEYVIQGSGPALNMSTNTFLLPKTKRGK